MAGRRAPNEPWLQRSPPLLKTKSGQVQKLRLDSVQPSPENDLLYRPVSLDDPNIILLAESIKKIGLKEPIVVTRDAFIVSGHRRYAACKLTGIEFVECRIANIIRRTAKNCVALLREYNRQRSKTLDEVMREETVSTDREDDYKSMIAHRLEASKHEACVMEIRDMKARAAITGAKRPMLTAVCDVIKELEPYWPLSDRQIHYALLNSPPLKHASKPDSIYRNDTSSYKSLTDLLTRARLEEHIPWHVIGDETRPVWEGIIDSEPSTFIQRQLESFLKTYWRNLLSSQPNHIEIVGEKNTILGIIRPIAFEYCIPLTIGRGYCSLDPRRRIAERFRKSGKSKLILLILSDFDPDGQEIAHSLARSLRDDFGIENIDPIKVALTVSRSKRWACRRFWLRRRAAAISAGSLVHTDTMCLS